jgi:hypothetical protein
MTFVTLFAPKIPIFLRDFTTTEFANFLLIYKKYHKSIKSN